MKYYVYFLDPPMFHDFIECGTWEEVQKEIQEAVQNTSITSDKITVVKGERVPFVVTANGDIKKEGA